MSADALSRRPIKARRARWAGAIAVRLQRRGLRPNQVSLASIAFAGLAAACLLLAVRTGAVWSAALYVAAAMSIQLRLLCNLFDGMLAIEGRLKTRSGEIFNDLPDRIADSLVLVAAGYSVSTGWGRELGWAAALLAALTAYVRVLGRSAGAPQCFLGPMAKQHRMAVMTLACLASAALAWTGWDWRVMSVALAVIALGSLVTVVRRTRTIVKRLESP